MSGPGWTNHPEEELLILSFTQVLHVLTCEEVLRLAARKAIQRYKKINNSQGN